MNKSEINTAREEFIQRFQQLESSLYLEEVYSEECPGCNRNLTVYQSKYTNSTVKICFDCWDIEECSDWGNPTVNICPFCDEIVAYEDGDEKNYMECIDCEQKAHLSCIIDAELLCDSCNIWACDNHINNYFCNECEQLHVDKDMIQSHGDSLNICIECFQRNQDLLNHLSTMLNTASSVDSISQNQQRYISEAKENFDLTTMMTHLIKGSNPLETLLDILHDRRLIASSTGYFVHTHDTKAVCFADLTTRGLLRHSKRYSPFGIAFLKEIVFERGGAPALYIREDLIGNSIADELKPFVTKLNLQSFDFHHEREWRVPCDFEFNYNQIAIVYAPTRYHNQIRQEFPQIKNIYDLDLLQLI